ncbi:MAG: pyridoxal 5'-phosphate synthase glutaminase subunit PdxT [Acidimicrobiia bacterium]|nr:MAG: pyridoxal 5'-phosphate synthase glutaminase subunit PdxT [Acidimicrobiia bacterium]
MTVGVLALQGDFREHIAVLGSIQVAATQVRTPEDLETVDALVIPGGESTTIGKLADRYGLIGPIRERCAAGMPALGTCAGMIFLAESTVSGHQPQLAVLDAVVERNAFGRQVDSFEADLDVVGLDTPMHAVFIRAPWIEKVGSNVEVLAAVTDPEGVEHPVLVRQGRILACSFHPELTGDTRLHRMLVDFLDAG